MHVAVASSGGRDSTALLHCTARLGAELGLQVHALHVHHGLHADADAWRTQVAAQVRRWSRAGLPVQFHTAALAGRPQRGDSIEAWARAGRYVALAELAHGCGCTAVLLAHHRRDQAETLLLQALRASGPAGWAAMPAAAQRLGIEWLRPWLDQPREAIEHYLRRHRLRYVEDPSNGDPRFDRNRLRLTVWPALAAAFPHAEATLAAAARRSAEAAACLSELAAIDAGACIVDDMLQVRPWQALGHARRTNLLRHWLKGSLGEGPPDSLVQRLLAELDGRRSGQWSVAGGWLRSYRGALAWTTTRGEAPPPATGATLDLSRPGRHSLPGWAGVLLVRRTAGAGIDAELLRAVSCRARSGGEQFCLGPGRPARSLKKQFQALDVPAWKRHGPLLFADDQLVFVPGLGVDGRCLSRGTGQRLSLDWQPDVGAS